MSEWLDSKQKPDQQPACGNNNDNDDDDDDNVFSELNQTIVLSIG